MAFIEKLEQAMDNEDWDTVQELINELDNNDE